MLSNNDTEKLLGLKEVIIRNIENNNGIYQVTIELPRKTHLCPDCGQETGCVHDYRLATAQKAKGGHSNERHK